jgi:HEAT repeat protein
MTSASITYEHPHSHDYRAMTRDLEITDYYIDEFIRDRSEDAWHSLVEIGPIAIPKIMAIIDYVNDLEVIVALLRLLGEYGSDSAIPALVNALADSRMEVWMAALDALVSIGGSQVLEALHHQTNSEIDSGRRDWIAEAIMQVESESHSS